MSQNRGAQTQSGNRLKLAKPLEYKVAAGAATDVAEAAKAEHISDKGGGS